MNFINRLDRWHQTKAGLIVFGLIELGVAYVFASWAIDSGRLLAYFLAIIFLVLAIAQGVKFIKKVMHYA
jgi:uncharacterized membrane protein HdeD (DUF308 family)